MTTYTQTFKPIRRTAHRKVTCPGCGKPRRIQHTFEQTINPFHPKVKALRAKALPPDASLDHAYRAVLASVERECAEWEPTDYESRHGACEEETP